MKRQEVHRARLRFGVAALMLTITITLSGCVSLFLPGPTRATSTPTGEKVDAAVATFYAQKLTWSACETGFQCATATAPLDWSNPRRAPIELALIRQPATGTPIGSLLVNPGGPGGSGYDFIAHSIDYAVDAKLRANYDIVGFDPRGVNRSSAVSCYDDPKQLDAFLFDLPKAQPGTPASAAEIEQSMAKFGEQCAKFSGDLLGFVDTVSAARDLDMLRAVLGDKKLNYLGYSYGTFLGATYAELFPKKTGRLVLDGALDPSTSDFQVTKTQAVGFESALRAYLVDCLTTKGCPFSGTVESATAQIGALLDNLDVNPIRAKDGRQLGSGTMFTAIILPLYSRDNWPALGDLFTTVMAGTADYAFTLADSYYSRDPNGTYSDNSTEAFLAINCLDSRSTSTEAGLDVEAAALKQVAPLFGPRMSYGGTSCAKWPAQPTRDRGPITAAGAAPILVVGTTNDPATPYIWAQALASQLESGHLVTYTGEGHTAYNKSNACVNDAVDSYLIDGTVPKADPRC